MRRIHLGLEYDGSAFSGFQRQGQGERTVQGVLEAALSEIPGARPHVVAAGRTDTGVHALEMSVHYDTEDRIPEDRIPRALNRLLPPEVRVLWAKARPRSFDARRSARWRAYRYRILWRATPSALLRRYALWLPHTPDLGALRAGLAQFVGEHDFRAFANQETRPTRRRIFHAELRLRGQETWIELVGSGFVRGQVRVMVGTLIEVALGQRNPEDIARLLRHGRREEAGPTAAPEGLYFVAAGYRDWPMREPLPEPDAPSITKEAWT